MASWMIVATGPSGEREDLQVTVPPATLRDLAVGQWDVSVRAVDWLGRRGGEMSGVITVKKDPITPTPPAEPQLTAGYGQIHISWDRRGMPHDAVVEVMALTSAQSSRPNLVHVASGSTVSIISARLAAEIFQAEDTAKRRQCISIKCCSDRCGIAPPKGEDGREEASSLKQTSQPPSGLTAKLRRRWR